MILMTDGISSAGELRAAAGAARAAHITVATVALGADADRPLLAEIAPATGGHAYVTDNAHATAEDLRQGDAAERQAGAGHRPSGGRSASDSPVVRSLVGQRCPRCAATSSRAQERRPGRPARQRRGGSHRPGAGRVAGRGRAGRGVDARARAPWASEWLGETALWNDAVRWTRAGGRPPPLTPTPASRLVGLAADRPAPVGTRRSASARIAGTLTDATGRPSRSASRRSARACTRPTSRRWPAGVYRFASTRRGPCAGRDGQRSDRDPVPARVLARLRDRLATRAAGRADRRPARSPPAIPDALAGSGSHCDCWWCAGARRTDAVPRRRTSAACSTRASPRRRRRRQLPC